MLPCSGNPAEGFMCDVTPYPEGQFQDLLWVPNSQDVPVPSTHRVVFGYKLHTALHIAQLYIITRVFIMPHNAQCNIDAK